MSAIKFNNKAAYTIKPLSNRIMMLVPHEPEEDPRINWVAGLCRQIGRTDIISCHWSTDKPLREYDDVVYVERANIAEYISMSRRNFSLWRLLRNFYKLIIRLYHFLRYPFYSLLNSKSLGLGGYLIIKHLGLEKNLRPKLQRWKKRLLASKVKVFPTQSKNVQKQTLSSDTGGILNSIFHMYSFLKVSYLISEVLYSRARASSINPTVIICHDFYALMAAVKLKKLFGCSLLYDSHELWPEADFAAKNWEKKLIAFIEQRLIQQADVVVTVTPQLVKYLEQLYGLKEVLNVPNAEPIFDGVLAPANNRLISFPLKFLLQGRVVPGRSIEQLFEVWEQLDDTRAILIIRSTENDYYAGLRVKFDHLIQQKRIVIAPPVSEAELISAASLADVGIIPYGGGVLNHIFACPNKLGQYMQAGLALLVNDEMEFVSDIAKKYRCGLTYNEQEPNSLIEVVRYLIEHPQQLQEMKNNAFQGARTEFNWQILSEPYKTAIQRLYHNGMN